MRKALLAIIVLVGIFCLVGGIATFTKPGVTSGSPLSPIVFGLVLLAAVGLGTNVRGLRSRTPAFNSPARLKRLGAWTALAAATLVALVTFPGYEVSDPSVSPGTRQAASSPPSDAPRPQQIALQSPTSSPKPTEVPRSTATPKPTDIPRPTATPQPKTLVDFKGQFDPPMLRVGQKLVVKLGLENKSSHEFNGFRIFSTGPWDKYTIVNVMPSGRYEGGWLGHNFRTSMKVPPGETRWLNIVAYPNEPGNHEFSFIPHEGENGSLVDESGEQPVIGGKIAVIR